MKNKFKINFGNENNFIDSYHVSKDKIIFEKEGLVFSKEGVMKKINYKEMEVNYNKLGLRCNWHRSIRIRGKMQIHSNRRNLCNESNISFN